MLTSIGLFSGASPRTPPTRTLPHTLPGAHTNKPQKKETLPHCSPYPTLPHQTLPCPLPYLHPCYVVCKFILRIPPHPSVPLPLARALFLFCMSFSVAFSLFYWPVSALFLCFSCNKMNIRGLVKSRFSLFVLYVPSSWPNQHEKFFPFFCFSVARLDNLCAASFSTHAVNLRFCLSIGPLRILNC